MPYIFDRYPHDYLVGGFNPSEKYESQMELLFPIWKNISHVPNHQPVYIYIYMYVYIPYTSPQDGAPKIAKLVYKWLISMVYGRYNELVNGD